jgi:O-antigen/teichoic acid export membrane protein
MTKTFVSNLLLIIFLNLIVKPFYILGVDAEVQNQVGSKSYGLYFALLNFSFLFNILLDFGITNYNTKTIAQHPHLASRYWGNLLAIRTLLFVVYSIFTLGVGMLIGYKYKDLSLLAVLVLNQFFVAVILFMRSNFSGLHLFRWDALFSVLDRVILIVLCSYLLWFRPKKSPFQIEWFIWAQSLAYGLSALTAFLVAHKTIGKAKIKMKRLFSIVILRQSFPYALLILMMMIYNRMDSVMLERIHPNGGMETGIYAQGFRLLDAVNMFALLFAGLLLPIFSRMLEMKESISDLLLHSGSTLLICSTVFSVGAFFYAYELIDWRYNEHIQEAASSFKYLILSFIPIALTYIFGTLLTANGSLRILNMMAFGGLVLNFVLNYALIPFFGATGAAIATLLTQGITALAQIIIAVRIFKLRFESKFLLRLIVFFILLFASNWIMKELNLSIVVWLLLLPVFFIVAAIFHIFPIRKSLALLRL